MGTRHQQFLQRPGSLGWGGKGQKTWNTPSSPRAGCRPQHSAYRTSLSICSSTSLSLKYVFHRLSGLGLRGCGGKRSCTDGREPQGTDWSGHLRSPNQHSRQRPSYGWPRGSTGPPQPPKPQADSTLSSRAPRSAPSTSLPARPLSFLSVALKCCV